MGREVRRVIPNWEHPQEDKYDPYRRETRTSYLPLYDQDFETAMQNWLDDLEKWKATEFAVILAKYPEDTNPDEPYREFCEWNRPGPNPVYYRPKWKEGEATWYQLYETVSEGTPVSPPFATKDELANYLATHGDFWYQNDVKDGRETFCSKPTIEQARSLVDTGWAMSFMAQNAPEGVKVMDAYEQQDIKG